MRRFALILVFAGFGCSFALVSGPPENHRQLPVVDCTTSRLGPGLDTVWTILQSINFTYAVTQSEADVEMTTGISRGVAIPLYAGLAALGAAGMYYGFSRTSECRAAKNELLMRLSQPGSGQPGYGQPGTWPPPGQPPAPQPPPPPPQPMAPQPPPP